MRTCNKCSQWLEREPCYERDYPPEEYLVGDPHSRVWIIGLNPKEAENQHDQSVEELRTYFSNPHRYYDNFKRVSRRLYCLFGKERGAAGVDLVKCASANFTPVQAVIDKCGEEFLLAQIREHRPDMLICNGRAVCDFIDTHIGQGREDIRECTSYTCEYEGREIVVVHSGFIGRIDNYSRRRLGIEIEEYLKRLGM